MKFTITQENELKSVKEELNVQDKSNQYLIKHLETLEPEHIILERHTDIETGNVKYVLKETFIDDFTYVVADTIQKICNDCWKVREYCGCY